MWVPSSPQIADDIQATLAHPVCHRFFAPDQCLFLARAPGRLDVMGGIADYSGALVLELPLALAAVAAVQADREPVITIQSTAATQEPIPPQVSIPLADLAPAGQPISYAAAQHYFARTPHTHWAAYLAGVVLVLAHEYMITLTTGLRILLDSAVPLGKGISSSAAIEVATMRAVAALYGLTIDGRSLALLCQKVENLVVGAPCGVMDQMTVACGQANMLLALRCQPAELEAPVALPDDLEVWGIDSGIRHAVTGADYGSVRTGAFMGYRILAELAGFAVHAETPGRVQIDDPLFHGYLANVGPSRWLHTFRDNIPQRMIGEEFLARYGGITDRITSVDPARTYAVRMPTEHPIHEHHRVECYRALLQAPASATRNQLLGELMFQSHASYSACGIGSPGTDRLVELVRTAGPEAGLYGAKITGGGSGGTVAILAQSGSAASITRIADQYQHETGRSALVIGGSSPGAIVTPVVEAWPGGRPA